MKNNVAGMPRFNDLGVGKRLLLAALAMGTVAGPVIFGLMKTPRLAGQVLQATGPLPSFEVASIKPDHSGSGSARIGAAGHGAPMDGFIATNYTIKDLICWAFAGKSLPLPDDEVSGGPSWINYEHYDIDAKLDDSQVAALDKLSDPERWVQIELMVQSLLADRFDLVVKDETVMRPVYALVIAKGGPKLQETVPGSKSAFAAVHGEITAHGMPISRLVGVLSRVGVGRPVLDQTGLKGNYDFDLKWTPDFNSPGMTPGPPPPAETARPDSSGPSIFTAIQEQLGLKLESTKGPEESIVIVRIKKPSEN